MLTSLGPKPIHLLLVGGVFNAEGGRPSGYFRKLAEALATALPDAHVDVVNGGTYEALAGKVATVATVSHLLWFADVPNELPKLLPLLKARHPALLLVSSKNNRRGIYDRPALFARMAAARSEFLVEFANGAGELVASVLTAQGTVLLERCPAVGTVARCLANEFDRLAALVFPLAKAPYPTTNSDSFVGRNFAHDTEIPLGGHVGAFGSLRKHHVHEGVDLYGLPWDPVVAMEPGMVVACLPFTGAAAGSPWWDDTQCVLVEGASGVLNYGELVPRADLIPGSQVAAGEVLGHLATVLLKYKGRPRTMLHLERYAAGTREPVREWSLGAEQPAHLRDPSALLVQAARNAGSGMKRVVIAGERGLLSTALQAQLRRLRGVTVEVVSTDVAMTPAGAAQLGGGDLAVIAVTDFASPEIFALLPESARVLDVSPAFRLDAAWVYGLPELPDRAPQIAGARRVANPGCFATSAILPLAPLVEAGLLDPATPLYLDAVGGYSTGGSAMVAKVAAGALAPEAVYSLGREHRHVAEIRHIVGLGGPVWFMPKIASFKRGIRMQVPLAGIDRDAVLACWHSAYDGTTVQVDDAIPSKLPADEWANKPGACLRVVPQPGGCLAICSLDNLGKGAVDSAFENLRLMLGLNEPASLASRKG